MLKCWCKNSAIKPNITNTDESIAITDKIIPIVEIDLFSSLPLPIIPHTKPIVPNNKPQKKIPIIPNTIEIIPKAFELSFALVVFFVLGFFLNKPLKLTLLNINI